jgi:hypothetical protein
MPGKGPVPTGKRVRPNDQARDDAKIKHIVATGLTHGPALPDGNWHERTIAWWETWRKSPQASMFTETDWDYLLDTALLHSKFWNDDASTAAELRLRVAKFGATPEDRARLKLEVTQPETVKPEQRAADPRRVTALKVINGS